MRTRPKGERGGRSGEREGGEEKVRIDIRWLCYIQYMCYRLLKYVPDVPPPSLTLCFVTSHNPSFLRHASLRLLNSFFIVSWKKSRVDIHGNIDL